MNNPFEMLEEMSLKHEATLQQILKLLLVKTESARKKEFLTLDGLIAYIAERTGKVYSKDTIYAYTSKGLLDFIKPGKELFFESDYIDTWLMEDRHDKTASLKRIADHMMIRANKRRLMKK
jgi:HSP90 family molecular chaperone